MESLHNVHRGRYGTQINSFPMSFSKHSLIRQLGGEKGREVSTRMNSKIDDAVREVFGSAETRAIYKFYPTRSKSGTVIIDNRAVLNSKTIANVFKHCKKAAVFLITLGPNVDKLIKKEIKTQPHYGYILDAVASKAIESSADFMQSLIKRNIKNDEGITFRYSPGYCDLPLRGQKELFKVLPNESMGVKLSDTYFMSPRKSVSGVIGIGPKNEMKYFGNACKNCEKMNCLYRREV